MTHFDIRTLSRSFSIRLSSSSFFLLALNLQTKNERLHNGNVLQTKIHFVPEVLRHDECDMFHCHHVADDETLDMAGKTKSEKDAYTSSWAFALASSGVSSD